MNENTNLFHDYIQKFTVMKTDFFWFIFLLTFNINSLLCNKCALLIEKIQLIYNKIILFSKKDEFLSVYDKYMVNNGPLIT
jgi:hypothetical protein